MRKPEDGGPELLLEVENWKVCKSNMRSASPYMIYHCSGLAENLEGHWATMDGIIYNDEERCMKCKVKIPKNVLAFWRILDKL